MLLRLAFLAFAVALAPGATAQPGGAQAGEDIKYWIFFSDDPTAETASPADASVSARALERRQVRGSRTRTTRLDAPVSTDYLGRLRALDISVEVKSRWFNAVSAHLSKEQRTAVQKLPFVRDVRPVGRLTTERTPPPSPVVVDYGPSLLQLDLVNARAALEAGYNGSGTIVGFLDTTFDFDHPVFATSEVIAVENFTGQSQGNSHGHSVASVAVGFAEGHLVGPGHGAAILAATTEYAPTETHQEEDFFVAGMEWMEANGADVVNVSLGYSTFDGDEFNYTPEDMDGNTTLVTRAADIAASLGIAVVTSAGNEGNSDWGIVTAPADADSVIAVGAVNADSSRAGFSSRGPTADGRIKPDVVALGVGAAVARPSGSYGTGNGTSYSAPLITGVVAQILQADPTLDPIAVRALLRATASQSSAPDNDRGWGVVDALAAIEQALVASDDESGPQALPSVALYPTVLPRGRRTLTVEMPDAGQDVSLTLYDVLGRRVAVLHEGPARRGPAALALPPLPAGVYFYRFTGGLNAGGRLTVQ